jgi:hypothetical protein
MMTTTSSDLNAVDVTPGAFPQSTKEQRLPSPPAVETPVASEESAAAVAVVAVVEEEAPLAAPAETVKEETAMVVDEVVPTGVAPIVPDVTAATMTPAISPTVEEAPKDVLVTPAVSAEAPESQEALAVTETEDIVMENAPAVPTETLPQETAQTEDVAPPAVLPTTQEPVPVETAPSLMGASPFMAPPPAPVAGEPVIASTASLPAVSAVAPPLVTPSALMTPAPMPPSTPAPASAYASSFATPNMLSTPFVPSSQPETPLDADKYAAALLQDQLRFCMNLTRAIKKRKDAFPFGAPVDPVLLNIPTYFTVIETPMDISTVEKKLQAGAYKAIDEFKSDFLLIFANCYKFNGEEAPVSLMGKSLEKHFLKEMEKLPMEVCLFYCRFVLGLNILQTAKGKEEEGLSPSRHSLADARDSLFSPKTRSPFHSSRVSPQL